MIPTLHIQLLGDFLLRLDDTLITTFDLPRLQALFTYLVLHRDAPQPRAHLAFLLWPDSAESQARTNLRTLLHRVRQALPHAERFVLANGQMVQWCADGSWILDVAEFEQALAQANQAEQQRDTQRLHYYLQHAVELYRGDLLPNCYDDWLLADRERLRDRFGAALERLILFLEHDHDYAAAVVYAQRLLRHDPLHEMAYQHLIRLHASRGDRASALRVYQMCAAVLERELGVEPSPATREAYERVRNLETWTEPAVDRVRLDWSQPSHNLPVPLTSFIGREHELAEVTRLLPTVRLLTLIGVGGSGKTRLALAAAGDSVADYPEGVRLVELAALTDAALLPYAIAAATSVHEEPQRPLITTLLDALRPRALLLVLDNCEHLTATCAEIAVTLLSACPRLRILATSREALGIMGELIWRVPSLGLPDQQSTDAPSPAVDQILRSESVRLFVERASLVLPTFTLTSENAAAVAQICRRLDGIPLAIELAAARVNVLTAAQIATRLNDSMRLLSTGNRGVLPRHQTLQSAIAWSYALLSLQEQAVFRRLAVFVGGWTLEAAEAVCADQGSPNSEVAVTDVLEVMARLVDKSLVGVEEQGQMARYRFLETIRQYAHARLQESGEETAMRQRHATVFLEMAEAAEPHLTDAQQAGLLERLELELDNVRAALGLMLKQSAGELAARLSGALYRFWYTRSHLSEGRRWLEAALSLLSTEPHLREPIADTAELPRMRLRAKTLNRAAVLAEEQGDYARATADYEIALALFRQLHDAKGIGTVLNNLGGLAHVQGDNTRARQCFEESIALFQEQGDMWAVAMAFTNLGSVAEAQDDYASATSYYEESLALLRTLGDTGASANVLHNLGQVAQAQGAHARARAHFEESLRLFRALGDRRGSAYCLEGLAGVEFTQGQPVQATRFLSAAHGLRAAINAPIPPIEQPRYERLVAAIRAELDGAVFTDAWQLGSELTVEQLATVAASSVDMPEVHHSSVGVM